MNYGEEYTLTNLVASGNFEDPSAWITWSGNAIIDYPTPFGSKVLRLSGSELASTSIEKPIVGHVYYGREYIKTDGDLNADDCRFEVHGGDGVGLNWVYGWNRGNFPEWTMLSATNLIEVVNAQSYVIRTFTVNGNNTAYVDGIMIIDLTAAFGSGEEPSKEWCDKNIPFFDTTFTIVPTPINDLITSRTQADVTKLKEYIALGWENMSSAQRAEFLAPMKGAYNYSDLNRVGNAVLFLEDFLNDVQSVLDAHRASNGVAPDSFWNATWGQLSLSVKTDWNMSDIPTLAQMTVYLQNVNAVTGCISITRNIPSSMDRLTVYGANEIEKALEAEYAAGVDFQETKLRLIENANNVFLHCGSATCGYNIYMQKPSTFMDRWKKYTVRNVWGTRLERSGVTATYYNNNGVHAASDFRVDENGHLVGWEGATRALPESDNVNRWVANADSIRTGSYSDIMSGNITHFATNLRNYQYLFLAYKWTVDIWGTYVDHQERGDYIETITAPEGTYPDDGIVGGYWYTREGVTHFDYNFALNKGNLIPLSGWATSEFIEVPYGCRNITIETGRGESGHDCLCEYGEDYGYLSYWGAGENPRTFNFDYPNDIRYIRATFLTSAIDNCYIYDNTHGQYIFKGSNI